MDVDEAKEAKYQEVATAVRELYTEKEFNFNNEDFEILSTIRYDPLLTDTVDFSIMFDGSSDNSRLFFLFDEHLHRTNLALRYFGFGYQLTRLQLLSRLNEALAPLDKSHAYKLRLTIAGNGEANVTVQAAPHRYNLLDGFNTQGNYTSPVWNVFIDTEPILISPFTSFKTTRRQRYTESRERMLVKDSPDPQEVLLYNTANQVTEGSITNIAFRDKYSEADTWITPELSSGCLCGVVRHMLISKGLVKEKQVNIKEVKVGDEVLLFNGIIGVVKGKIMDRSLFPPKY